MLADGRRRVAEASGVAAVAASAALFTGWSTYDRPQFNPCPGGSGIAGISSCEQAVHGHVRVLPTVSVGLVAGIYAAIVVVAYARQHWLGPVLVAIAAGVAIGEVAAYKTYVYPNVYYSCISGHPCRPNPQPHVDLASTVFWGTVATALGALTGAFAFAKIKGRAADGRHADLKSERSASPKL